MYERCIIIIIADSGLVFLHNFSKPWHEFQINHSSADRALLALIKCAACCSRISNHAQTQTRVCLLSSPPPSSFAERRVCVNLNFAKNSVSLFSSPRSWARDARHQNLTRHQLCLLFLPLRRNAPLLSDYSRPRCSLPNQSNDRSFNSQLGDGRAWVPQYKAISSSSSIIKPSK